MFQLLKRDIERFDKIATASLLLVFLMLLSGCEAQPSDNTEETNISDTAYEVSSFSEYLDIFMPEFESIYEKHKSNFGGCYTQTTWTILTIDLYSNPDVSEEEFETVCRNVYPEIEELIKNIKYNDGKWISGDITVNIEFHIHDCNQVTSHDIDRGCYNRRVFEQWSIDNKEVINPFPELEYGPSLTTNELE